MHFYEVLKFWVQSSSELIKTSRQLANRAGERIDKIIVWIVGFDVAAIGFLISGFREFDNNYTEEQISVAVILFASSLMLGILSRVIMAVGEIYNTEIQTALESRLLGLQIPFMGTELTGHESPELLIMMLEQDFNVDVTLLMQHLKAPSTDRERFIQSLRDKYNNLKKYYETANEACRVSILDIHKLAFDYSDAKIKKLDDAVNIRKKGIWNKRLYYCGFILYGCSLILFIAAVLTFAGTFLQSVY